MSTVAMMSRAVRLQPVLSFHELYRWSDFPAISHRLPLSPFSSNVWLLSSTNQFKIPRTPVHAQAKRGFSLKEDEVASRKLTSYYLSLYFVVKIA